MLRYLDYLFLIRPVLMPPVWTILLLGHRRSSQLSGEGNLPGLALILVTFLVGGVYVLNQIFDIESDRLNQKLFFLARGYVSKASAVIETILLNLLSVIPAFLISLQLGLLFLLGMISGFLYSASPFAFKNRPLGGLTLNALAHGNLAFLIGWSMNQSLSVQSLLVSLPYMFAVAAIYLNTTIPDMDGDRKTGKTTLAVRWGKENAVLLACCLVAVALVLSFLVQDIPFLLASSLSFPFFVYSAFSKKERQIMLSTKVSILLLSIAAGIFYPWYFAVLILGFLGTRLYYKARFSLDYPTLL
ncbi:MAG: UbiA family prenyltransferase [Candidatus Zixiibacteriota bacterium]|nr:MAG: UbiA family prenyltransferase [candidate division Zixibacteria bacterium]